jgi:hypothetical protein
MMIFLKYNMVWLVYMYASKIRPLLAKRSWSETSSFALDTEVVRGSHPCCILAEDAVDKLRQLFFWSSR